MNGYNATAWSLDGGVFVVELDKDGDIIRSNSVQCTGLEGTKKYGEYLKKWHSPIIKLEKDNCRGYINQFKH